MLYFLLSTLVLTLYIDVVLSLSMCMFCLHTIVSGLFIPLGYVLELLIFNTLRPRQNGWHFADDIFKRIFFNKNVWISIKISLKFVSKGLINNIPALVQIMAWRRPGAKPLSEAMMVNLPTHICVSRPQLVKTVLDLLAWTSIRSSKHGQISEIRRDVSGLVIGWPCDSWINHQHPVYFGKIMLELILERQMICVFIIMENVFY